MKFSINYILIRPQTKVFLFIFHWLKSTCPGKTFCQTRPKELKNICLCSGGKALDKCCHNWVMRAQRNHLVVFLKKPKLCFLGWKLTEAFFLDVWDLKFTWPEGIFLQGLLKHLKKQQLFELWGTFFDRSCHILFLSTQKKIWASFSLKKKSKNCSVSQTLSRSFL